MQLVCSECGLPAAPEALFCAACGGLLEFRLAGAKIVVRALKAALRERRSSNEPLDTSGVWRYREKSGAA
jgi:hypothetical protein